MQAKKYLVGLAVLSALVTGCSKSGSSPAASEGILGAAVKPGFFPDGTKSTPVTKQQAQNIAQLFSGTVTVLASLAEASSHFNFGALAPGLIVVGNNNLTQEIENNCQIIEPNTQPSYQNVQRRGQQVSGDVQLSGMGSISGANCPLVGRSSLEGAGQFAATLDQSGQTLRNFSATGQGTYQDDVTASGQLAAQYGFTSMNSTMSLFGQISASQFSGSQSLGAMVANIKGTAVVNTTQFKNLGVELLSELNVSNQSGHPTGNVKVAVIVNSPEQKLLLQVFVHPNDTKSAQIYLNGQPVDSSWFKPGH